MSGNKDKIWICNRYQVPQTTSYNSEKSITMEFLSAGNLKQKKDFIV